MWLCWSFFRQLQLGRFQSVMLCTGGVFTRRIAAQSQNLGFGGLRQPKEKFDLLRLWNFIPVQCKNDFFTLLFVQQAPHTQFKSSFGRFAGDFRWRRRQHPLLLEIDQILSSEAQRKEFLPDALKESPRIGLVR